LGGVWGERWILEATIVVSDDLQVFHSIMLTTTSVHSVTHFHKGMIPKQSRRAGPTLLGNGMIVPYDETLLTLQCRRKACPGRLYTLEAHYLEEENCKVDGPSGILCLILGSDPNGNSDSAHNQVYYPHPPDATSSREHGCVSEWPGNDSFVG
jgi:hypothetical protein